MRENKIFIALFFCIAISIMSVIMLFVLLYQRSQKKSISKFEALFDIPALIIELILLAFWLLKLNYIFSFNFEPIILFISITWFIIVLCIFISSFAAKSDKTLQMLLLTLSYTVTVYPGLEYKSVYKSFLIVSVTLIIINSLYCKSTKNERKDA
jgi:hypothetical protein